jgi:hypothetical protein
MPAETRPGHFHAVQFYEDEASLTRIVAEFLAEGMAVGDPAVVIATPEHLALIETTLQERAINVEAMKRLGDLILLDARETLATFMVDGLPHAGTFKYVITEALNQVRRGRQDATIRAYGEMVNVLWKDGLEAAAIRLETLWNELANSHDFKLLCGYSMGNFYKGAAIEEIKGQHSHLVRESGTASIN